MLSPTHAAVLGSPVAHSLSPVLHRAAYAWLGLADWTYEALEVRDDAALRVVLAGDWAGLSLTMPLKRFVLPMLDVVTDLARDVGAVNTVVFGPRGRVGHNTDVEGMVQALSEAGVSSVPAGAGCVVGGGATAASALAALATLGDRSPSVVLRDVARAADLAAAAGRLGVTPALVPWDQASPVLGATTCVISTVPASGSGAVVVPTAVQGVLLDVVYDPWPTPLTLRWERAGGTTVGGFTMLLHQAVGQVRLMTGLDPSTDIMRTAGLAVLGR